MYTLKKTPGVCHLPMLILDIDATIEGVKEVFHVNPYLFLGFFEEGHFCCYISLGFSLTVPLFVIGRHATKGLLSIRVSGQIREFYKVYWCFKGKKDIISQVKGELHMDLGVVVKLMSNLLIKIIKFRKEGFRFQQVMQMSRKTNQPQFIRGTISKGKNKEKQK
ncbi:uncharacterized protein LOC111880392 isoform X3 [Lactuca sativa]|uniref:uncharacterized protein LOC111880392 isoform X3 n=1 Tax=Lactuca sativa TaxID=4236 RepID=UPI000CD80807|nr:uncharacterized protein LOC111880392 isoform X3 [Lactuca sativa]